MSATLLGSPGRCIDEVLHLLLVLLVEDIGTHACQIIIDVFHLRKEGYLRALPVRNIHKEVVFSVGDATGAEGEIMMINRQTNLSFVVDVIG